MAFIYNWQRKIDQLLERANQSKDYPIIKRYYEDNRKSCGPSKTLRKIQCLIYISKESGKSLGDLTENDFKIIFDKIDNKYSINTRRDYIGYIKQFCKWFDNGRYYPYVGWKKRPGIKSTMKSTDMISPETVKLMVDSADKKMWKAWLEGMYYSGCRPGEIASLKAKDVTLLEDEIIIHFEGGKNQWAKRDVIVIDDVPNFRSYVQSIKSEQYLFPQKPYWYFHFHFKRIVRKAGLEKRIWFYLFRHSGYTHDLEAGLRSTTLDAKYGHAPDSNIGKKVYTHLSQKAIREDLRRIHGVGNQIGNEKIIIVSPFIETWVNN